MQCSKICSPCTFPLQFTNKEIKTPKGQVSCPPCGKTLWTKGAKKKIGTQGSHWEADTAVAELQADVLTLGSQPSSTSRLTEPVVPLST